MYSNNSMSQVLFVYHKSIAIFNNMKFTTSNQFTTTITKLNRFTYDELAYRAYKIDLID